MCARHRCRQTRTFQNGCVEERICCLPRPIRYDLAASFSVLPSIWNREHLVPATCHTTARRPELRYTTDIPLACSRPSAHSFLAPKLAGPAVLVTSSYVQFGAEDAIEQKRRWFLRQLEDYAQLHRDMFSGKVDGVFFSAFMIVDLATLLCLLLKQAPITHCK